MSSFISLIVRPFLQLQKLAQRNASVETTRNISRWAERLYTLPNDMHWEKVSYDGLIYEWLTPRDVTSQKVLFYIHGGGFVLPLCRPLRCTISYLSRLTGMRTVLINYRLAPEYPFPAAVDDCVKAYRWLIQKPGISPKNIIFTGESAGGNLVVTTLLSLREAGDPLPAGVVSVCPVFDFEGGGTFYKQKDALAQADFVMRQLNAYRGTADPHTPMLSPLYADLEGLPPLFIQVGGDELFRSGAEALAVRAKQDGVQITLRVWPGMWHFWHVCMPWLPEAQQALVEIRDFIGLLPEAAQ
jgi:monoterpene epsilon-lactone hydrolase